MTYRALWGAVRATLAGEALPDDVPVEYIYNDSLANTYIGPDLATPDFPEPPDGTTIAATIRARPASGSAYTRSGEGSASLFVNRPPVWSPIPDQTVAAGESIEVDLSEYVTDRGQLFSSYEAFEESPNISVSRNGAIVTVNGISVTGVLMAEVEVGATDLHGATVPSSFNVSVTPADVGPCDDARATAPNFMFNVGLTNQRAIARHRGFPPGTGVWALRDSPGDGTITDPYWVTVGRSTGTVRVNPPDDAVAGVYLATSSGTLGEGVMTTTVPRSHWWR